VNLSCDIGLICTAIIPWPNGEPDIEGAFSLKPEGATLEEKLDHLNESLSLVMQSLAIRYNKIPIEIVAYEDNGARAKRGKYASVAKNQRAVETVRRFFLNRGIAVKSVQTGKDCKQEAWVVAKKYGYRGNEHTRDALLVGFLGGFSGGNK